VKDLLLTPLAHTAGTSNIEYSASKDHWLDGSSSNKTVL